MSFLGSLKKLAKKAKCATGFHSGQYSPIEGKPECNLEKTCSDCHKYITTIRHDYGAEKYKTANSCIMVRICSFCGETKEKEKHEGFKKIDKDDYCQVKEQCVRCRYERLGKTEHSWQRNPQNTTETHIEYRCVNCNKIEMREKRKFS